jgi:Retroviral aspartyl protease
MLQSQKVSITRPLPVNTPKKSPIANLTNSLSPNRASDSCAKMETVFPLKSRNYKVSAAVGVSPAVLSPVRAILDTGAGPNLVRASILPADWERYRVLGELTLNIFGAGGRRLRQKGTVTMVVEIGRLHIKSCFLMIEGLAADCILGCLSINKHVTAILP